jgi:hypothetical protein
MGKGGSEELAVEEALGDPEASGARRPGEREG